MEILQATVVDEVKILTLQKLAYQSEAERYNNYDIPPLKQTLDEMKDQFRNHIFLKAVSEGRTIGIVRAYEKRRDMLYRQIGRPSRQPKSGHRYSSYESN